MNTPDDKLQRLLGSPDLLALRQRLRRHFERQDGAGGRQALQLTKLDVTEREALASLMGWLPSAARSARIDIARIDAALRAAGICDSLREALERLDGPITNRAAERAAADAAWSALVHRRGGDTRLLAWLQTAGAGTLLKRLSRQDPIVAGSLLARADAVLRRLPSTGIPRAQLAAQALGNAHALDAGQPAASVVLAVWRCAASAPNTADEDSDNRLSGEEPSEDAGMANERVRDIWARAGVLVNELARPALTLNLPVVDPATATWRPGEPSYLSLRQLVRTPPAWSVDGLPVFVCENPNLLAIAADRLGVRCAPMVCTDGMPAAAQRTLLDQLLRAGAQLHYHGDFDWPGLRIANHIMCTWQAEPWRMAASDYEAAALTAPHSWRDLLHAEIVAAWDPLLGPAMCHHGLSIAEEAVADGLIEDLRRP